MGFTMNMEHCVLRMVKIILILIEKEEKKKQKLCIAKARIVSGTSLSLSLVHSPRVFVHLSVCIRMSS